MGPTLSFRGIDNQSYYRLVDGDPRHYFDTTGTGNSLLMRSPHALQLITDSLRYWVTEMHVDGFRFDLAATLARQFQEVDKAVRISSTSSNPGPRSSHVSNSSPNRGISAPAATRWAGSRRAGPNGTAVTATACATSALAAVHASRVRQPSARQLRPGYQVNGRRPGSLR